MNVETKTAVITEAMLRELKACAPQRELFAELFPKGISASDLREACVTHAGEFDFDWAAEKLLSLAAREEYLRIKAPAWQEYHRVNAPAWQEYCRVAAAARQEYYRVTAAAHDEYHRVTADIWQEYDRVTAAAREEYHRVKAAAFADAFLSEH